jgi:hypothetical protein
MAGYGSTEARAIDPLYPPQRYEQWNATRAHSLRAATAAVLLLIGVVVASTGTVFRSTDGGRAGNLPHSLTLAAHSLGESDDDDGDRGAPQTKGRNPRHKRGTVCESSYAQAGDLDTLSGVGWHYSWSLEMPDAYRHEQNQQEFVPQVWGLNTSCNTGSCLEDLHYFIPLPTTTAILGFNEPNFSGQSNLTGAEACAAWPVITSFAKKHGLRVGAPAVGECFASSVEGSGSQCFATSNDWLEEFFAACGLDSVDFIPTHWYGTNATLLLHYVTELNKRFSKPIWLTEFSCSGATAENQLAFQKWVLPKLDALPNTVLERYAWFATRTDVVTETERYASLLFPTGPRNLTNLGKNYNDSRNRTTGTPTTEAPTKRVIGGNDDVNLDDVTPHNPE